MSDPYRTPAEREAEERFPIPAFSGPTPTCRKCMHHMICGPIDKYDALTDRIARSCTRCSFTWFERAADHSGDSGR